MLRKGLIMNQKNVKLVEIRQKQEEIKTEVGQEILRDGQDKGSRTICSFYNDDQIKEGNKCQRTLWKLQENRGKL